MSSSLLTHPELLSIHKLLNDPPTGPEMDQAITTELRTVQDVVRYAVSCMSSYDVFLGHGHDNYWSEATEIVQAVMHLTPPCDDSTLNSRLTQEERALIARILKLRVIERIPTPYLTNRAFFCGRMMFVDSRALIPRSPLGELIDQSFAPYLERQPDRVLDMCTGSGCIAVAMALHFNRECEVDAVDISEEALEVCRINIEAYGLEDAVTPIRSDLFAALPSGDKYNLIVANPPYVSEEEYRELPLEYSYEPRGALIAENHGLECAVKILAEAAEFLDEDGVLVMEVGNSEEELLAAFPAAPFHIVDLKRGGSGVLVISCEQLAACRSTFAQYLADHHAG